MARPFNLAPLPQYGGQAGIDPDYHLGHFRVVCTANMIPEETYLHTFSATLIGSAQEWFQTHSSFENWNTLRDAFLA